jgi:hypothetical protein
LNALPLIHRELLVASRRPRNWWRRVGLGLLAILLFLLVASGTPGGRQTPASLGSVLFGTLVVLGFIVAALAGIRTAGISLCEENREGTLELLLLTDLKRHGLALGKVAAAVLEGLPALLVFVPILTCSVLTGGVTFSQIWMAAITLGLTLVLSNAVALYVAATRTQESSMALLTLTLLALFCVPFGWLLVGFQLTAELDNCRERELSRGGRSRWRLGPVVALLWLPLIALFLHGITKANEGLVVFFASPAHLLYLSLSAGAVELFWVQLLALLWFLVPVTWLAGLRMDSQTFVGPPDDSPITSTFLPPPAPLATEPLPATSATARPRAARDIGTEPVAWRIKPPAERQHLIWLIAVVMSLASLRTVAEVAEKNTEWLWPLLAPVLTANAILVFVLDYLVAGQAARFLVEARSSGSLEMLLVTPGFRPRVIREVWLSLRRTYLKPVLVVLSAHWLSALLSMVLAGQSEHFYARPGLMIIVWTLQSLKLVTGLAALGWLALWLSWYSPRPAFATVKAFGLASLVPVIFLSPLFAFGALRSEGAVGGLLMAILFHLCLIAYARHRLQRNLVGGAPPIALRRN